MTPGKIAEYGQVPRHAVQMACLDIPSSVNNN
jgi:hypothetical protein